MKHKCAGCGKRMKKRIYKKRQGTCPRCEKLDDKREALAEDRALFGG